MGDAGRDEDYAALRGDAGAVWLPRDVVRVGGPEAVSYLQGQLSQDVEALTSGASAESLLLSPQGKVDALVRVTRTADDEVVIDVDGGYGEAVVARLRRFKLRTKADIEALAWRCLALRGPRATELARVTEGWAGHALPADWPGLPGVDLLGEDPPLPDGARVCGTEAWEAVRVEAGIPRMGAELTERTIPAEAGVVERTVSFTKGCYTGQELVARIDARGSRVPRHLRGLVLGRPESSDVPPVGAAVVAAGERGERELGQLTSVAVSPALGAPVALAYVRREVEPPAEVVVRWGEEEASGRVAALPLVA
jgi:folate-binding protein YgfZ